MRCVLGLLILLGVAALAGCSTPAAVRFANPMILTVASPGQVEVAARRTLTELRFEVEFPPAAEGRTTTLPLTGASWFEFWREDTRGESQSVEASMHTMRRKVTVVVTPKDQGCQVLVKVDKQRASAPNQGPDNIAEAFSRYHPEESELVRQNELAKSKYKWIDMGRDDVLEQYILERIQLAVGRAGKAPRRAAPAAPAPPPAGEAPAAAPSS